MAKLVFKVKKVENGYIVNISTGFFRKGAQTPKNYIATDVSKVAEELEKQLEEWLKYGSWQ